MCDPDQLITILWYGWALEVDSALWITVSVNYDVLYGHVRARSMFDGSRLTHDRRRNRRKCTASRTGGKTCEEVYRAHETVPTPNADVLLDDWSHSGSSCTNPYRFAARMRNKTLGTRFEWQPSNRLRTGYAQADVLYTVGVMCHTRTQPRTDKNVRRTRACNKNK